MYVSSLRSNSMMKETKIMDVFNKYMKKFDMNKGNVKALYFHSIKMMDLCKNIASSLGIFSEEEIIVCGFLGLFHDIGMMSNKNKLCHFINDSVDYSKKSVDILFDSEKLIRTITDDVRYDDIIKIAMYCHNKKGFPNGLNDKVLHFCKVLKDAHIIDNFRLVVNYPYMDMYIDNFPTDLVYNAFKRYNVVTNQSRDNDADNVLEVLSYIFEINYQYSFLLIKEEECVNKLILALKIENKSLMNFFNQIGAVLNMYIDRKVVG